MLSDDAIEKLMQPIIDRQENINNYVIGMIAKRIREIGKLSPSDIYRLERLFKSGTDAKRINDEISRLTGLQIKDIKKLIKTVAMTSYVDTKPFYDYRHISFLPFEENKPLQRIVEAVTRQTLDTYRNLSNTTAFMIRDPQNLQVLKPTPIAETYQSVIDESVQAVQSGTVDYNSAMRRTINQLIESGIRRVYYSPESGRRYSKRLDSAVRMNLLDAVRQINQKVQDITGEQYGADGKELSAHPYSAPDHEPFQGRQFTLLNWEKLQNNESFQDVNGNRYIAVERIIGQWNCRHFAWSIIIGFAKPNYTEEQLKEWAQKNAEGYTLPNGKKLTMYQCTQYQRKMETSIRYAKDGQIAARAAGDIELIKKYQMKVNKLSKEYRAFSKACGLSVKRDRTRVSGYKPVKI